MDLPTKILGIMCYFPLDQHSEQYPDPELDQYQYPDPDQDLKPDQDTEQDLKPDPDSDQYTGPNPDLYLDPDPDIDPNQYLPTKILGIINKKTPMLLGVKFFSR